MPKKLYYSTKLANQKNNPKQAWKTNGLLGRQKQQSTINELHVDGEILINIEDIAEGFNDYFSKIGPQLANKIESSNYKFEEYMPNNIKSQFATFQPTTVSTVYKLLCKLSSNKATGIDKISSKTLKIAAPIISDSLTYF